MQITVRETDIHSSLLSFSVGLSVSSLPIYLFLSLSLSPSSTSTLSLTHTQVQTYRHRQSKSVRESPAGCPKVSWAWHLIFSSNTGLILLLPYKLNGERALHYTWSWLGTVSRHMHERSQEHTPQENTYTLMKTQYELSLTVKYTCKWHECTHRACFCMHPADTKTNTYAYIVETQTHRVSSWLLKQIRSVSPVCSYAKKSWN